jgi:hypothetical protein
LLRRCSVVDDHGDAPVTFEDIARNVDENGECPVGNIYAVNLAPLNVVGIDRVASLVVRVLANPAGAQDVAGANF